MRVDADCNAWWEFLGRVKLKVEHMGGLFYHDSAAADSCTSHRSCQQGVNASPRHHYCSENRIAPLTHSKVLQGSHLSVTTSPSQ